MDFSSISNINSYMKTLNMNHIWKQNANNPFKSVVQGSSSKKSEDEYKPASPFGDERLMSIKTKMQSGQKLSSDDMDYLRENDPATYDELIKMEREKKEYEKELGRCKTKDDARILHLSKVTTTLVAVKSGTITAEVALAKLAKMAEAYEKFTESSHYSKMAENHLELAKAIEAETEAITGNKETPATDQEGSENEAQSAEDIHEPLDTPNQAGSASDSADIESFKPQFAFEDKPKPVDTGKSTHAIKVKADIMPTEVKPSFSSNKAASSESYDFETATQSSRGKLDRQV